MTGPSQRKGVWLRAAAVVYAVMVLVVLAMVVAVAVAEHDSGEANFVGVWLILVALPLSIPALWVPADGWVFIGVLGTAGLVQASLLWSFGGRRSTG